jgi:hypothetical protein
MMAWQARASASVVRLWKPHDLGRSCLRFTIRHHVTNETESQNAGALGPNQTGLTRNATQPDLARPNWTVESRRLAVILSSGLGFESARQLQTQLVRDLSRARQRWTPKPLAAGRRLVGGTAHDIERFAACR